MDLGTVFEADDLELNRRVALKKFRTHHPDDRASRQRFVLESAETTHVPLSIWIRKRLMKAPIRELETN